MTRFCCCFFKKKLLKRNEPGVAAWAYPRCTNCRHHYIHLLLCCRNRSDVLLLFLVATAAHSVMAGTIWNEVEGGLKSVSVGKAGVWGVESYDGIDYRAETFAKPRAYICWVDAGILFLSHCRRQLLIDYIRYFGCKTSSCKSRWLFVCRSGCVK